MNNSLSTEFSQRLRGLHQSLKTVQPDIQRVAVALYDEVNHRIKTFSYSSDELSPLVHYETDLADVPSLAAIAASGKPRLINDMRDLRHSGSRHTSILLDAGLRSSYTVPIIYAERLLGFVFFNSPKLNAFDPHVLPHLDTTAYAISLLITNEQAAVRTLQATMKSAIEVTHERNPETGEHLKRIAGYTRLIAFELAESHALSDEFIERLVMFSSLHDIGKISIPDAILLKRGRLTEAEFEVMRGHASKGRMLVDSLIANHALASLDHIDVLRDIVELHHENWDGSGYPKGLAGGAIPLAARIVAVSDVFDALTSERPYKSGMSNEDAFAIIRAMAWKKLDPECADAFLCHPFEIENIRRRYASDGDAGAYR